MAKLISAVCISAFVHLATNSRINPPEVVDLDEETFKRLEKAGCVKEADAADVKKANGENPKETTEKTGGKKSGK